MVRIQPDEQYKETEQTARRGSMGLVTKVIERDGEAQEFTNHEVNVQLISRDEELKALPVHVGRMGQVRTPATGDFVEVSYLSGKTQSAYVSDFAYSRQQRAPLARAGHWRHRFGEEDTSDPFLFLEAEPSDHQGVAKDFDSHVKSNPPDVLRMGVKEDGLSDPSLAIELDTSGSDPVASIRSDEDTDGINDMEMAVDQINDQTYMRVDPGDDESNPIEVRLDLSAGTIDILTDGGTVRIGDQNGTFKKVARKGDQVEVSGVASGSSTEQGQITEGSSNVEAT